MATDPLLAARRSAPPADDPTSDLVAQMHNYSRAVIEAELRRLARRAPSLRPNDLDVIDAALDELAESLFLARLRSLPQHTAQLKRLFGTAREDS
ncbi:hypothetical protein GA0070624_5023 [Micromonospora rhizosphaerae]|uniref:Uncharacterized protein n=1 Tax=Micromonospora rhizosphaerae TaxID=568872 RepID=A0A1C6SYF2_9ACTN|nr:hypothetical protein [Micromonospora rhizosphaerae]SCL34557.1 hypothetical protein GA0070624_5023 [Micromonospora rhizosphaerae]